MVHAWFQVKHSATGFKDGNIFDPAQLIWTSMMQKLETNFNIFQLDGGPIVTEVEKGSPYANECSLVTNER